MQCKVRSSRFMMQWGQGVKSYCCIMYQLGQSYGCKIQQGSNISAKNYEWIDYFILILLSNLPTTKCSWEIWLTAAWCSGRLLQNYWFDTLLHCAAERFDSLLQNSAERLDSLAGIHEACLSQKTDLKVDSFKCYSYMYFLVRCTRLTFKDIFHVNPHVQRHEY
jgi:hypothetical protein